MSQFMEYKTIAPCLEDFIGYHRMLSDTMGYTCGMYHEQYDVVGLVFGDIYVMAFAIEGNSKITNTPMYTPWDLGILGVLVSLFRQSQVNAWNYLLQTPWNLAVK